MKVEVNGENYQKYLQKAAEIDKKLSEIKSDTAMFSTHSHIYQHPVFPELVGYGEKIIPYLINKILHKGSDWLYFILLREITKANPVPSGYNGSFIYSTIHWLKWYTESGYYENDDVYHGLVN